MSTGSLSPLWRYIKTFLGMVFRHPLLGMAAIPVLPDGRIVLVRRRDSGQWSLPGGLMDWGEDLATTVRRELREEIALEVISLGRVVGVYSDPNRDPRLHSVCIAVEAHVRGPFHVADPVEILDVAAFLPTELPLSPLAHDHARQLQDYLDGRTTLA